MRLDVYAPLLPVPAGFTKMWGEDGRAFLVAPIGDRYMASLALEDARDLAHTLTTAAEGGVAGSLRAFAQTRKEAIAPVRRQAELTHRVTFTRSKLMA